MLKYLMGFERRLKKVYRLLEKMYTDEEREDFFAIELARSIDARFAMKGRVLSCIEILPDGDGYRLCAFDKTQIEVSD